MKTLYILEAEYRDKINRVRKNHIVGVYANLEKLENAKNTIISMPHDYNTVTFSIRNEIQPFHA